TLPGDEGAGRSRDDTQDAVSPCDRDQFRIGVDASACLEVGLEVAALGEIVGLLGGAEFGEAEDGGGVDQAGVEMQTRAINDYLTRVGGAAGPMECIQYGVHFAVLDGDVRIGDGLSAAGV